MGTALRVAVAAPSRVAGIHAIEEAFGAVRRVDSLLSTWRDDSEIARLNEARPAQPVTLSSDLYALLVEAARWSRLTDGAFDPAIGPLIDAWDLRRNGRVPSRGALSEARKASGIERFVFADESRTITRPNHAAWIDTGAFGKGVALREARRVLQAAGIRSGILNFGGQVVVLGGPEQGRDWVIPVAHPHRRAEAAARLHLRDGSASTSSQSERFIVVAGRRVGHILDPRSGQPVPPWGSVTVIAKDPTVADVVSTALLVLGPEEGLSWARRHEDLGVLFLIDRDGRLELRGNAALEQFLISNATLIRRS